MARGIPFLTAACLATGCIIITPGGTGGGTGQPPQVYCVKDKASGACWCSTTDPGLNGDTEYVTNCDTLPADTQCCYDINGDGETKSCDCERLLCAYDTDTNLCDCKWFGGLLIGNNRDTETVVATCPTTSCCKGKDLCRCFNGGATCFDDMPVSSCTTADLPAKKSCAGGTQWAANCSGLKWTK